MSKITGSIKRHPKLVEKILRSLLTDVTALKTAADSGDTGIEEIIDDHALLVAWMTEVDADLDLINDYNHFMNEPDGVIGGDFTIAAGAAVTLTGAGDIEYRIDGVKYFAALDTTITLEDDGDVDTTKWRAWRIEIIADGTVTALADGDTQHPEEIDALNGLGTKARTASSVVVGYFTIDSDGGFNIGTDNVNGETAANVYVIRGPEKQVTGLNAALGATIAADTDAATWSSGTINANVNGAKLAEIAAIVNQAMTDADVISTLKWGAWLLTTDVAGTGIVTTSADGSTGAASTMAYTTEALALAAIDTLVDQLPAKLCPIGIIMVYNGTVGNFTAGTTKFDAADVVTTVTNCTLGTWDRTALTGLDSHIINPPAIPASIASTLIATLTASDPTDVGDLETTE